MKGIKLLILFVVLLFNIFVESYGDYRYYAWTYQYMTMLPGRTELEIYNRFDQKTLTNSDTVKWKRQIELETGLTDRWDFSFYLVDSYKPADGKIKFEELKFRTRFKLANKEEFFVDPILYLEYKFQADRSYKDKLEVKLILARDIENLNLAFNIILEEYYKAGTMEKDWKTKFSNGVSYSIFGETFRTGLEITGDLKEGQYSFGPVLSFKGGNLWIAMGTLFGLNEKSDDLQSQIVMGILL